MLKVLSGNFFCVQRDNSNICDVYTVGSKCEVVRCVTCQSPNEAIHWVQRAEGTRSISERYAQT